MSVREEREREGEKEGKEGKKRDTTEYFRPSLISLFSRPMLPDEYAENMFWGRRKFWDLKRRWRNVCALLHANRVLKSRPFKVWRVRTRGVVFRRVLCAVTRPSGTRLNCSPVLLPSTTTRSLFFFLFHLFLLWRYKAKCQSFRIDDYDGALPAYRPASPDFVSSWKTNPGCSFRE